MENHQNGKSFFLPKAIVSCANIKVKRNPKFPNYLQQEKNSSKINSYGKHHIPLLDGHCIKSSSKPQNQVLRHHQENEEFGTK